MADIGAALAQTVIFLYPPNTDPTIPQLPIGSAFIVGYPVEGRANASVPLIVTCRHVIGELPSVLGRFTLQSGQAPGLASYDLDGLRRSNDLWIHDDDGVDIVVFRTPHFGAVKYTPFPKELIAREATIADEDVKTTDRVVFPGLLFGYAGLTANYPVVRDGSIALLPQEDVPLKYKVGTRDIQTRQRVFLLNGTATPGASGSPVYLLPGLREKKGAYSVGGTRPLLLGIIHGFYSAFPREVQEVAASPGRMVYSENSGIALAFPAWRLIEILEKDAVKKRVGEIAALLEQDGAPSKHP